MLLGKLLTPMVYILENMKSNINQKNGLRTEKVVNGTTTRYAYTDDHLPHYNQAGQTMYIRYGANGEAIGFWHGGVEYTYMKNLQGGRAS